MKGARLILGYIMLVLFVLALLSIPYLRLRTFNKFSKTKATFIDAIFGELRVTPDR